MFVGLIKLNLTINLQISSLKDKRRIVKGIKDKLRNSFNISISEIDQLDKYYQAGLGISLVSNEKKTINTVIGRILNTMENMSSVTIENIETEIL